MAAQEPQKSSNTTPDSASEHMSDISPESASRSEHQSIRQPHESSDDANSRFETADSPDLLRWRADILLDEMMLGAVDTGGGYSSSDDANSEDDAGRSISGEHLAPRSLPSSAQSAPSSAPQTSARDIQDADPGQSEYPSATERPEYDPWRDRPYLMQSTPPAPSPPNHAESRFSAARRERRESDTMDHASGYSADAYSTDAYSADSEGLRRPQAAQQRYPREEEDRNDSLLRPPSATTKVVRSAPETADQRQTAYEAERAQKRRNNLLPRMSQADVDQLRQQITALTTDVERLLPAGHDWYTRSEHLLERADHILRTSPERSAEVEYYLQQIRAIIGRAQQTNAASQIYRRRLVLYHMAWLMLSMIVLVAYLLFTPRMTDWMNTLFRLRPEGFLSNNLAAFVATLAAATLGAALGGLVNMQRYRSQGRGFFDRKYSLRGLFLPIFALLVASIVYAVAALVFWLSGVNPALQPLWTAVPAVAALLYGFWQEHVYGTAP